MAPISQSADFFSSSNDGVRYFATILGAGVSLFIVVLLLLNFGCACCRKNKEHGGGNEPGLLSFTTIPKDDRSSSGSQKHDHKLDGKRQRPSKQKSKSKSKHEAKHPKSRHSNHPEKDKKPPTSREHQEKAKEPKPHHPPEKAEKEKEKERNQQKERDRQWMAKHKEKSPKQRLAKKQAREERERSLKMEAELKKAQDEIRSPKEGRKKDTESVRVGAAASIRLTRAAKPADREEASLSLKRPGEPKSKAGKPESFWLPPSLREMDEDKSVGKQAERAGKDENVSMKEPEKSIRRNKPPPANQSIHAASVRPSPSQSLKPDRSDDSISQPRMNGGNRKDDQRGKSVMNN